MEHLRQFYLGRFKMIDDGAKKYKAFISYSHNDEQFGSWLHRELEKYKIPKRLYESYPDLPKSLYPIFRDRYELDAGDNLGEEIPKALKNSNALVVICSKSSANSKWVNKEIIDFKMMHGEDRIFPIIIEGEPFAKESDKFDNSEECFPDALKYKIDRDGNLTNKTTDILASSTIEKEDGRELAKLKLIAGLLDVPFGEFYRRDLIQKEEELIQIRKQKEELEKAKNEAEINLKKSIENEQKMKQELYRNMVQRGMQERDFLNHPLKAKLFFSKAISISSNIIEEKNSKILYDSMNQAKLVNIFEHNASKYGCWGAEFSKNEQNILSWSGKMIKIWDKNSTNILHNFQHDKTVQGAIFNKSNTKLLSWGNDQTVRVWGLNNSNPPLVIDTPTGVYRAQFTQNEKYILSWGNNESKNKSFISLYSLKDNKIIFNKESNMSLDGVVFDKNEEQILYWNTSFYYDEKGFSSEQGFVKIYNIKTQETLLSLKFPYYVNEVSYSKNQDKLLISSPHSIKIWDLNMQQYLFLTEESDSLLDAKFSPDESKILARYGTHGSAIAKKLKLWETNNSQKPLYTFQHNYQFVNGYKFNKDGTRILTWGYDGYVKLWSAEDGTLIKEFKHNGRIAGSKFFDDENKILSWTGVNTNLENDNKGSIYLWDADYYSSKPLFMLKHNGIIYDIKISDDEKQLLSYGSENMVKLWDISLTNFFNITNNIHTNEMVFNQNSNTILAWDEEYIQNIDINTKKVIFKKKLESGYRKAFYNKSGKKILTYANKLINVINIETNNTDVYEYTRDIKQLLLSENEDKLFVAYGVDRSLGFDKDFISEIVVWDLKSKKKIYEYKIKDIISNIMLTNNNDEILFTTENGLLNIININTNKNSLKRIYESGINNLVYNKNKNKLLFNTSTNNNNLIILDIKQQKEVFSVVEKEHATILGNSFSKDQKHIFRWGEDGKVKMWNIMTQKLIHTFSHEISAKNIMLSSNSDKLYSWSGSTSNIPSGKGTVKIWDTKLGTHLLTLRKSTEGETGIQGIALNNDETLLFSWLDHKLDLWDISHGTQLLSLPIAGIDAIHLLDNQQEVIIQNESLIVKKLFEDKKYNNKYYSLEAEVESGTYLDENTGEVKVLSKKEWEAKKAQYDKIIKKYNP